LSDFRKERESVINLNLLAVQESPKRLERGEIYLKIFLLNFSKALEKLVNTYHNEGKRKGAYQMFGMLPYYFKPIR